MSAARAIVPLDVAKATARTAAPISFDEYWTICVSSMQVDCAHGIVRADLRSRSGSRRVPIECPPSLSSARRREVVHDEPSELRRRHIFLREKLPIEVRQIVEADLEADVGDLRPLVAHEHLAR